MAKQVAQVEKTIEREYVIPLRKEWVKVPRYKRTAKSVKAIKEFVAKHMRVPDRNTSNVKLDIYLNNELFFRGVKKPPAKIKVKVKKVGDIVKVELADEPEHIKFLRATQEKRHKKVEKKKEEPKAEEKKEEPEKKTEGEKKEEKEKEKSGEQAQLKMAEQAVKAEKHMTKGAGPQIQRKALKK